MALRMTRVPDKETESLPIPTNIDTDPDWTGRGVFDGVFHQLVKDHRRDRETAEPLVLADIDSKQLLHPHFLKVKIGTDKLQFFRKGHGRFCRGTQGCSQNLRQGDNRLARFFWILGGERLDDVKAVKEEVRVET